MYNEKMLHILQTGDLHLGKIFYGVSLIADQKFFLEQVISILKENLGTKNEYHALFIAGDIYDKAIPSIEAVALFDDFLTQLNSMFPNLPVFIISGNHDSATRLSYAANFLKSQKIFIATDVKKIDEPTILCGSAGEKFAVYQIPFLQSGALENPDGERLSSQSDLVKEAVRRIECAHKENPEIKKMKAILNAHLFVLGGAQSSSERIFIGNAELVEKSTFDFFDYVSIGHLHKGQKVSEKCYYAGSPLVYSFDEISAEKNFLDITLGEKNEQEISVRKIPVSPLHKTSCLKGKFEDFYRLDKNKNPDLYEMRNDYIELTCTDSILIENPVAKLRENFPNILSVKQECLAKQNAKEISKRDFDENSENFSPSQIFENFLKDVVPDFKIEEWQKEKEIFESFTKEIAI